MKSFDLKDGEGRVFAFEVSNTFLTRAEAYRVLLSVAGAVPVRPPKRWQLFADDEFCEVAIDGVRFVAWEPFGDNSRFWIGSEPPAWNASVEKVRSAFELYRPSWGYLQWLPLGLASSFMIWTVFQRFCDK